MGPALGRRRPRRRAQARPDPDLHHPHFLGAVVLQQVDPVGLMQQRTIIDGQQRLTTLQLLLDALHAEDSSRRRRRSRRSASNSSSPTRRRSARRTRSVRGVTDDRRDRPAFDDVMATAPAVNHDALSHKGEKMVEAHRFFGEEAREWLNAGGPGEVDARAAAIDATVHALLQMVVLDLNVDENAQEIFET